MFIVLEGIDGTGKSTVCRALSEKLSGRGYKVAVTREPTDLIRPMLSHEVRINDPTALFLLFTADRIEHQAELEELLSTNDAVICDRYLLSSFAYQGVLISEKLGGWDDAVKWMTEVSRNITLKADLTLLLDSDPGTSLRRIAEKRGDLHPYFEREQYLEKVRDAYRRLMGPGTVIIDSSGDLNSVIDDAMNSITSYLIRKE